VTARRALPGRTSRGTQKYSGPGPSMLQVPEPTAPEGPRAPVPCGAAGSV